MPPPFSYTALNQLALSDTGHFVFLNAWAIGAVLSIMDAASPLYLWTNDQFPLTQAQIDDLEAKLASTQEALMQTLVGLIMPVITDDVPEGTLLCDGTTHLREDYPRLYAALDAAYRIDAATFIVPDLRGRFVLGASLSHPPNETGGSFSHMQTVDEMPTHTHTNAPHAHTESGAVGAIINGGLEAPASAALAVPTTTAFSNVTIDVTGGGQPMDTTPPYLALRYVVVAL